MVRSHFRNAIINHTTTRLVHEKITEQLDRRNYIKATYVTFRKRNTEKRCRDTAIQSTVIRVVKTLSVDV